MSEQAQEPAAAAKDWREEGRQRKVRIVAALAEMKLSLRAQFIPFSQSRSKGEKLKTLNWSVTVVHGDTGNKTAQAPKGTPEYERIHGRDLMTVDYGAGQAHCPAYNLNLPRHEKQRAIDAECETGKVQRYGISTGGFYPTAKPILPDTADVFYSLVLDSSVLDSGGFEDWAQEYGYETDSRKAEAIYRACLEQALKLRACIGEKNLSTLRELFQDY